MTTERLAQCALCVPGCAWIYPSVYGVFCRRLQRPSGVSDSDNGPHQATHLVACFGSMPRSKAPLPNRQDPPSDRRRGRPSHCAQGACRAMTLAGWIEILLVLMLVLGAAWPLGAFMADVFDGRRSVLSPVVGPLERGFYRLSGVDPRKEQNWLCYTLSMIVFAPDVF